MNELTSELIGTNNDKIFNISLNETLKQSRTFDFESGKVQTIGNKSIPSIIIDLVYRDISQAQYDEIETAYQNNHSNTFLIDLGQNLDIRLLYNLPNNGVFTFGEYGFETSINQMNASEKRYTGKITIITSVIFNYTQFQDIYNQPSSYTPKITTNEDFLNVLDLISPQKVIYGYELNKRFTNLGQSTSTQRDLGNNKRTWKLDFLCQESEWIELITFFRKKGGLGLFGIPKEGYFKSGEDLINARFKDDNCSHQKMIGNVYLASFEIIEVK